MDISSDKHLTFSINMVIKHSMRIMMSLNRKLKKSVLKKFLRDVFFQFDIIENPYHNAHHTFEVLQMTTYLIRLLKNQNILSKEDKTLLQVAAICHDHRHRGISNSEWDTNSVASIRSSFNSMTSIDEDVRHMHKTSYNEILHVCSTVDIVHKYKDTLFPSLSLRYVDETFTNLILSTDIEHHHQYMDDICMNQIINPKKSLMTLIIKLADVSHIMRPFHIHLFWVYKLISERSHERTHHKDSSEFVAEDTLFFAQSYVQPLLKMFVEHNCNAEPDLLDNYNANIKTWRAYIKN